MAVRIGLETLLEERLDLVRHRSAALIVNQASVDSGLRYTLDRFHENPEIRLTAILGPQHGLWGETQDNMIEWSDLNDSRTRLPVYSLYGTTRAPSREMLSEADVVIFDLQDVGSRYYTFVSTMVLSMQACRELEKPFIVLDRPNPINGVQTEGPVLDPEFSSFVGLYPLPVRHGMTVGELALYFNSEFEIGAELEVIRMSGWEREMFFDQTGLPWVAPSPNMPALETAIVYPGMCLFEATNVSEGRGTTRPFEFSGAPWADPFRLAGRLEELPLPGVFFRPLYFIPTFHKWRDRMVGGVQIHVRDRNTFQPFRTGVALLGLYRELGGDDFQWNPPPYEYEYEKLPIDILAGNDRLRSLIESGATLEEMEKSWLEDLNRFRETRRNYLIY